MTTETITFCDTVGCDNACEAPHDDICLKCQKELEEEDLCADSCCTHRNCRQFCCWCGNEKPEDAPEYDSARDRDFDRETDAINEARV